MENEEKDKPTIEMKDECTNVIYDTPIGTITMKVEGTYNIEIRDDGIINITEKKAKSFWHKLKKRVVKMLKERKDGK